METKRFSEEANKAECMNNVHSYINEIVPKLIKRFSEGVRINGDDSIFKKHKEEINAILKSVDIFRAYLRITRYSISIEVDAHYADSLPDRNGCYTCSYYKQTAYIYDRQSGKAYEFNPLKIDYSKDYILRIKKEIEEKENQARELSYQISSLKREIGI